MSSNVLVLREEEAFSFGSLVADVGGVLGLFIGFNFLEVWEWTWNVLQFVVNNVKEKSVRMTSKENALCIVRCCYYD